MPNQEENFLNPKHSASVLALMIFEKGSPPAFFRLIIPTIGELTHLPLMPPQGRAVLTNHSQR